MFTGFSNQYDVAAANEQYQAALARAAVAKQQVIQQVFTAYYTLAHVDRSRPHVAPICSRARRNPRRWRASGIAKASEASSTC